MSRLLAPRSPCCIPHSDPAAPLQCLPTLARLCPSVSPPKVVEGWTGVITGTDAAACSRLCGERSTGWEWAGSHIPRPLGFHAGPDPSSKGCDHHGGLNSRHAQASRLNIVSTHPQPLLVRAAAAPGLGLLSRHSDPPHHTAAPAPHSPPPTLVHLRPSLQQTSS